MKDEYQSRKDKMHGGFFSYRRSELEPRAGSRRSGDKASEEVQTSGDSDQEQPSVYVIVEKGMKKNKMMVC